MDSPRDSFDNSSFELLLERPEHALQTAVRVQDDPSTVSSTDTFYNSSFEELVKQADAEINSGGPSGVADPSGPHCSSSTDNPVEDTENQAGDSLSSSQFEQLLQLPEHILTEINSSRQNDVNNNLTNEDEMATEPCCGEFYQAIVMENNLGPWSGPGPCTFHESYFIRWNRMIEEAKVESIQRQSETKEETKSRRRREREERDNQADALEKMRRDKAEYHSYDIRNYGERAYTFPVKIRTTRPEDERLDVTYY